MASYKCKFCGQDIRWVTTEKGRKIPVSAKSSIQGTFTVEKQRDPDNPRRSIDLAVWVSPAQRDRLISQGKPVFQYHKCKMLSSKYREN